MTGTKGHSGKDHSTTQPKPGGKPDRRLSANKGSTKGKSKQ